MSTTGTGQTRVVTGLGTISPVGADVACTWKSPLAWRRGVAQPTDSWAGELPARIVARAAADPAALRDRVQARRMDRCEQLGIVAAREAWADAGAPEVDPERLGVLVSSGIGGLASTLSAYDTLREKGWQRVPPFTVPMLLPNGPAGWISLELGARPGMRSPMSVCASGAEAIGYRIEMIRLGRADVVFAGGAEAVIIPFNIAAFAAVRALTTRTTNRSAPPGRSPGPGRIRVRRGRRDGRAGVDWTRCPPRHDRVCGRRLRRAHRQTRVGVGAVRPISRALADGRVDPDRVVHVNAHAISAPSRRRGAKAGRSPPRSAPRSAVWTPRPRQVDDGAPARRGRGGRGRRGRPCSARPGRATHHQPRSLPSLPPERAGPLVPVRSAGGKTSRMASGPPHMTRNPASRAGAAGSSLMSHVPQPRTLPVTDGSVPVDPRPPVVPGRIPVGRVPGPFPAPISRYLRALSEAAAADSVAAVAAREDIVRLADRQDICVVVAAQAVLEDTCTWPAVSRFRLLNYLKAGLIDVSVAADHGWQAEPLRPGGQDLHILTLRPDTGRLLGAAMLRRPAESAGARMADRNRPLLLVEEVYGIGVYDCIPELSALRLDQVAEVKRLVRDQDLRGMAGLRVALETTMAACLAPHYAWDRSVPAWLGDLEPNVVGRLLSFLHARVHLVEAQPSPTPVGTDGYLRQHFSARGTRPFVMWTAENGPMDRRCAQVGAILALPDKKAAQALAALAASPAAQQESP